LNEGSIVPIFRTSGLRPSPSGRSPADPQAFRGNSHVQAHRKVAVVTGASKGIGAAIAKALAAQGASVVVNYASSKGGGEAVVDAITAAGGKAIAVGGDVSKAADAQGLIDAAIKAYGRLDILVNNAGVYEFAALGDISEDHFHKTFNINVLGLLPHHSGPRRSTSVKAPASSTRLCRQQPLPAEFGRLHRLEGRRRRHNGVLAIELGPRKIRVNAINPGGVETEGTHSAGIAGSDFEKAFIAQTPLGRIGQPEDIADIAVFLASDDARG
jgi:3-oxoacyl-[acyl-carrier protein] reductase